MFVVCARGALVCVQVCALLPASRIWPSFVFKVRDLTNELERKANEVTRLNSMVADLAVDQVRFSLMDAGGVRVVAYGPIIAWRAYSFTFANYCMARVSAHPCSYLHPLTTRTPSFGDRVGRTGTRRWWR